MRDLQPKRYDLMLDINVRGTFVLTQACLPHLRESDHAHVLTLSPPLSLDPRWLKGHSAYTVSKFGMSMITLGVAADEAERSPPTASGRARSSPPPPSRTCSAATPRWPPAAHPRSSPTRPTRSFASRDPRERSGNTYLDDEVLAAAGITDLSGYAAGDGGRARARPVRGGLGRGLAIEPARLDGADHPRSQNPPNMPRPRSLATRPPAASRATTRSTSISRGSLATKYWARTLDPGGRR